MASFLKAFNASLVRRPMLTQCASSAVMFGIGDVLAQQAFEKKGTNHDFLRTARTAFYGGALFGPLLTKWLDVLNRIKVQSRVREVAYKVWLDQTVFTPAVVGFFFTSMTLLEGKSFSDAQDRLSTAYVPTLIRNWGVFVPTQIFNFALVPPQYRFFTIGTVALFWNAYLSAVNARNAQSDDASHAAVLEKVEAGVPVDGALAVKA
ncbi:uncharacterized protein B0H18DRAFT_991349 [Fomitopsis serialis]|uniref:uncharacterized protein n=1 Tax=Fomitopsis serialis TaxID=139415 RepID=UPI002007CA46|nr:uncharacterized protein B0H18DRAFT_991349 [Neoantrodia serialis]KAH9931351.1 hypothetical protein B0H18DRAFT_991349 [Neoantrodia serialis]